ncbi:MAG: mechanosensitive ion channel family protein [Pedobacter sp.]|nr:MAG: mechanosensitive ion channel family protein [Pedobacter sp.]
MDLKDFKNDAVKWIVDHGPSFLLAMAVLFVGMWLIKLISKSLNSGMQQRKIDPSLKPFLISLSITVLRVILVLGVLSIMSIPMTIFGAIVGGITVAAGLALSGTLQNFASGVIILFLKPFAVGDNIIAQGQEGTVTSIQIFYTIVTTFDNRTIIFPNSKLSNEVIINISRIGSRRLDIEIKFSNAIDFNEVKKQIQETVDECLEILKEPEVRIGISSIENDGYKVMINAWLNSHGFVDGKMMFQQRLMEKLRNSGLKLPGL